MIKEHAKVRWFIGLGRMEGLDLPCNNLYMMLHGHKFGH